MRAPITNTPNLIEDIAAIFGATTLAARIVHGEYGPVTTIINSL